MGLMAIFADFLVEFDLKRRYSVRVAERCRGSFRGFGGSEKERREIIVV